MHLQIQCTIKSNHFAQLLIPEKLNITTQNYLSSEFRNILDQETSGNAYDRLKESIEMSLKCSLLANFSKHSAPSKTECLSKVLNVILNARNSVYLMASNLLSLEVGFRSFHALNFMQIFHIWTNLNNLYYLCEKIIIVVTCTNLIETNCLQKFN